MSDDQQFRQWTARLRCAAAHWRECLSSAHEAIGLLMDRNQDLRFQLDQMTTRKQMWHKRAIRNATAMHDLERQNRVLQARLTLLESNQP